MLQGGFSAWEKQGLDVQSTDVNYKTTVFDSLSDEVESLGERASSFLRCMAATVVSHNCHLQGPPRLHPAWSCRCSLGIICVRNPQHLLSACPCYRIQTLKLQATASPAHVNYELSSHLVPCDTCTLPGHAITHYIPSFCSRTYAGQPVTSAARQPLLLHIMYSCCIQFCFVCCSHWDQAVGT